MKCVIYVRVSTDEQAKHGFSIASQIEKLEAYCVSQDGKSSISTLMTAILLRI
ncbi:recombinase family protein [Peribacillus simplex]